MLVLEPELLQAVAQTSKAHAKGFCCRRFIPAIFRHGVLKNLPLDRLYMTFEITSDSLKGGNVPVAK